MEEPVAVPVHRGPVAVRPDAGEPGPVRREEALGIAPDAARHAWPGPLAHEFAHRPAERVSVRIEHVHVEPERRKAERHRFGGRER